MDSPLAAAFDRTVAGELSLYTDVEGSIRADAALSPTGVSLSIDVETLGAGREARRVDGGVLLTVLGTLAGGQMGEWRAGRRVRVAATLRRPISYHDPDVADREEGLARQGVALVGTVKSGALVEVLARGSPMSEAAASVRRRVRATVAEAVAPHSARSAAIVTAIVIGDRAGLDPDVQRALQEAGTYHVIAISGGNIAILAGFLLGACRLLGIGTRVAACATIAVLAAYADLVGGGASVVRATLMGVAWLALTKY
jgi:competence protein ComEC